MPESNQQLQEICRRHLTNALAGFLDEIGYWPDTAAELKQFDRGCFSLGFAEKMIAQTTEALMDLPTTRTPVAIEVSTDRRGDEVTTEFIATREQLIGAAVATPSMFPVSPKRVAKGDGWRTVKKRGGLWAVTYRDSARVLDG